MSMSQYYLPHVPGVPGASVEQPDVSAAERRRRRTATVGLGLFGVALAGGVVAERVGALPPGLLAGAIAVAFALSLVAAVTVDVVVTVRRRPSTGGVRPGLRAASFCYIAALMCLVVTFAFLAG